MRHHKNGIITIASASKDKTHNKSVSIDASNKFDDEMLLQIVIWIISLILVIWSH